MVMLPRFVICLFTAVLSSAIGVCTVRAEPPAKTAPRPLAGWVKKSNQNTALMIKLMAKLEPELAPSEILPGDRVIARGTAAYHTAKARKTFPPMG